MPLVIQDPQAYVQALRAPPPLGAPHSLPIPGSEREGRSAVYRHWRFVDGPLLQTVDPTTLTAHDMFENSAKSRPNARCLGSRPWDPVTKTFGKYKWLTYKETAERRRNFGIGIVELHKTLGVTGSKYGVGLWCQNRPEWQITGMLEACELSSLSGRTYIFDTRSGVHVSISLYGLHL